MSIIQVDYRVVRWQNLAAGFLNTPHGISYRVHTGMKGLCVRRKDQDGRKELGRRRWLRSNGKSWCCSAKPRDENSIPYDPIIASCKAVGNESSGSTVSINLGYRAFKKSTWVFLPNDRESGRHLICRRQESR